MQSIFAALIMAAMLALTSGCSKSLGALDGGNDDHRYRRHHQRQDTASRRAHDNSQRYVHQDDSAPARRVLDLANQQRKSSGVSILSWDNTLAQIAQIRAKEISEYFSHTRPGGKGWDSLLSDYRVHWSRNGENIAKGQNDAQEVMRTWMNSSGHRANILDNKFTHMGVGVYRDGRGQHHWVQIFIRR